MRHLIILISLMISLAQCQKQYSTTKTFFPMVDNGAEITLLGSTDRTTTWAAAIPTDNGQPSYDGFDLMTITDNGISMSYEFTRTSVPFEISTNGGSTTVTGNIETTSECDYSHNYLDPKQAGRWPPISEVVSGKTLNYRIPFTKGQEHQASCKAKTNWSAPKFTSGTMTRERYTGTEEGYRDVTITPGSKTNVLETQWGTASTFGEGRVQETGSSTTRTAAMESVFTQSTSESAARAVEETSSVASKTVAEESGSTQSMSTQAAGAAEITVWKEAVVVVAAIAALAI